MITAKFAEGMQEMSGWERTAADLGDQEPGKRGVDGAGDWGQSPRQEACCLCLEGNQ